MTTRQIFRGRTLMEARRAAEQAFGGSAVLLTTREVRRPGLAGFLGTTEVEVVAAAPEPEPELPPAPEAIPRRAAALFALGAYKLPEAAPEPRAPSATASVATLRSELRSELRALKASVAQPERVSPEILAELVALRVAIEEATPELLMGDQAASLLRSQGIDGPVATMLARSIRQRPDDDRPHLDRLRDALAEVMKVSPWPLATEGRAVIALVGPAGVGKTTTIAKLAAHARMASRSITLISCDGVRVGAVEQLQRYASLLGAGFATAGTREELADCIDEADSDLVFVDTAGSPPKPDGMESMLATASFGRRPFTRHVLLCLPAALRAQDATATVRAFAALEPTALAITKLDETSTPSGLVHGTIASQLLVVVLCAGQSVPEHIAQATMTAILDQVMPRPAPRGAQA